MPHLLDGDNGNDIINLLQLNGHDIIILLELMDIYMLNAKKQIAIKNVNIEICFPIVIPILQETIICLEMAMEYGKMAYLVKVTKNKMYNNK